MAIPTQVRSVDPFSSYDSDNVSRLTRIVTSGEDKIAQDGQLEPSIAGLSVSTINITQGIAVKDDILIHITADFDIDTTDPFNYADQALLNYPTVDEAYIVLQYQYIKTPQAPEAQILLLNDVADYDPDLHIFLGKAHFDSATTVDLITLSDGSVVRPIANLCDAYTDQDAIDAQVIGNNNIVLQWTGTVINYFHGLGQYPIIQIMESSSGELVQAILTHISTDEITIDFDPDTTANPFDFVLIY
jgi:hypothetical protein